MNTIMINLLPRDAPDKSRNIIIVTCVLLVILAAVGLLLTRCIPKQATHLKQVSAPHNVAKHCSFNIACKKAQMSTRNLVARGLGFAGVLRQGHTVLALFAEPHDVIVPVQVGDCIGKQHWLVQAIYDDYIVALCQSCIKGHLLSSAHKIFLNQQEHTVA